MYFIISRETFKKKKKNIGEKLITTVKNGFKED